MGASNQSRSLPFDAERTVNLYPIVDQNGKEPSALYGTPGLLLFGTAGTGPIRAAFTATNGRCFFVSSRDLYELNSDGTASLLGTTTGDASNIVSIDENGTQLAVCDGEGLFIFTYATNAFAEVTDADLPTCSTVTFIDGYFVVTETNTGKFYISDLYDGFVWNALDFATAESSPDKLLRVKNAIGQLWLLGEKTTEIWTNTGDSTFPFQRIAGAKIEVGVLAAHTAIPVDNTLMWVGKDNIGSGIVYRASGFTPKRVSTEYIERKISAATDQTKMVAYTYQQDGHVFYVITGGGLETTLVYDITTGVWHERAYLETDGSYSTHLGFCCTFAFNKHLVGDRRNGNIYQMSLETYTDNGDEILRERIYTHVSQEGEQIRFNSLDIYMENGVGLQTGQGSNPLISLQLSKDGARTWSSEFTASIGAVGLYQTMIRFRRLGIAEIMTFKLRISEPVKICLIGSYLK